MRLTRSVLAVLLLAGLAPVSSFAQSLSASPEGTVPRLIHLNGVFHPAAGATPAPVEEVTLGIYAEEVGGLPLWQETQSVAVGESGQYSLILGASHTHGVPLTVFAAGEPRWLGVTWTRAGQAAAPRVRLTSVPYALRASDAETLGGLPPSAFLRAEAPEERMAPSANDPESTASPRDPRPLQNTGTPNYIGKFVNSLDLTSSALYDNGGFIGVGTNAPLDVLHTRFTNTSGSLTGFAVQNLGATATSYSGMLFYDHTGALGQFQGFNNLTKEYRINNVAPGGSINFLIGSSSRFLVRSDGDIELSGSIRKGGVLFMHNRGGAANVGLGERALEGVTSGARNVAVGFGTLPVHSTGVANTAVGNEAMANHTSGNGNVAIGDSALASLTSGHFHVAIGYGALAALTTSGGTGITANTAVGMSALNLTTGPDNTATGFEALDVNTSGFSNTATGRGALGGNTTGISNTAMGTRALQDNTIGFFNTAIGVNAGSGLTTGHNNVYIGAGTGAVTTDEQQTLRVDVPLGLTRAFIGGIRGISTGLNNAVPVVIDGFGQLGTVSSSRRTKDHIQDLGAVSRTLFDLRPVQFTYKQPFADGSKPVQYGLIAEEVEAVLPALVAYGPDGQPETVKYHVLPTLLLAEVQRLERDRARQAEDIAALREMVERLQVRLTTAVRDQR